MVLRSFVARYIDDIFPHERTHNKLEVHMSAIFADLIDKSKQMFSHKCFEEETAAQVLEIIKPTIIDHINKFYSHDFKANHTCNDDGFQKILAADSCPCIFRKIRLRSFYVPRLPLLPSQPVIAHGPPVAEINQRERTTEQETPSHETRCQSIIRCAACFQCPPPTTSVLFGREDGTYEAKMVYDLMPDPPHEHLGEHILCTGCSGSVNT